MLLEIEISTHSMTLTLLPLRFVCEATTPLRLEESTYRAGSNLRGALEKLSEMGLSLWVEFCPTPHSLQSAWGGWGRHPTVFTSPEAVRVWSQEAFTPTSSRQSDCQ